ncbi:MAG TPA: hypothetical protein VNB06_20625 [Thermoanaerobaculia bacterium]|nr:hypothetical protein [Thermoanaerobaculia bacterium]
MPLAIVAQSVQIGNSTVRITTSTGTTEGFWNRGDDLTLGGADFDGDLIMRNSAGTVVITLDATTGDAVFGGAGGQDGDIFVRNSTGTNTVLIDGQTGNLTNIFAGNGLAKAWARMNANGTVASCFGCSTSSLNTGPLGTGSYEVDFTISGDISSRPWLCSIGHGGLADAPSDQIGCVQRSGDLSSIFVRIENDAGAAVNQNFTIVVF